MNLRHGDICFTEIKTLPEGLEQSKSKEIARGSNNNPHTYTAGKWYPKVEDTFVIGYFIAGKSTKLYHPDHGKKVKGKVLLECKLPVGIYQVRKQNEETNEGMKPIQD